MNTAYDDLVASIATASSWDNVPADLNAAVAAYAAYKKDPPMTATEPHTTVTTEYMTKLVLAGSRACTLAYRVMEQDPGGREDPSLFACASAVLSDWGLEWETPPAPEAAPDELIWPPVDLNGRPLASKLSPAYFKVYWHVHEPIMQTSKQNNMVGYTISPEDELIPVSAHWDEATHMWRMKLRSLGLGGDFWVGHCNLKPGTEIPT